jgi:hypothetical protein
MDPGSSVLSQKGPVASTTSGGGNSGAVISPAPGLGLSAYQDPNVKVSSLLKKQGGS